MKRFGIWLVLSGLLWLGLSAQPAGKPLRVGLGMSGLTYRGDFTQSDGNFLRVYPGLHVSLQFDGPSRLQMQLRFGYGHVVEQSDERRVPNLPGGSLGAPDTIPNQFFRTSLFLPDLRLRFRFLRKGPVQPFVGVGLGLVVYDPRDQGDNLLADNILSRRIGETYDAMTATFPLMAGCDFRLHQNLGLGLTYTFRPTQSDFIDNVGSLGRSEGNDQLHELTLSLQVYLETPAPAPPKPVESDTLPPLLAEETEKVGPEPHDWREFLQYYEQYLSRDSSRVETLWSVDETADSKGRVPAVLPEDMLLTQVASYYDVSLAELNAFNQALTESLPAGTLIWLPPLPSQDR
jgi:opacity protein-like surface antigen